MANVRIRVRRAIWFVASAMCCSACYAQTAQDQQLAPPVIQPDGQATLTLPEIP